MYTRAPSKPRILTSGLIMLALFASIAGCGSGGSAIEPEPVETATSVTAIEPSPIPTYIPIPTVTADQLVPDPTAEEPTPTIYDPFASSTLSPTPDDNDESDGMFENEVDVAIDAGAFHDRVDEIVGEVDGELEIVVSLADGTILYERDSAELMEAASLYKLAIMVELFRQREAQDLSFDDEIVMLPDYFLEEEGVYDWSWVGATTDLGSLLTSMIAYSSNVAAAALLARLGNDSINQTMDDIGLYNTRIRWTPGIWVPAGLSPENPAEQRRTEVRWLASTGEPQTRASSPGDTLRSEQALNVTTAADIAALYVMLLNGEIVSAEASEEMLDLLVRQVVNDRLPLYLPEGTIVAHKTGNWDGLVHDAGVIWSPSGPIVVVVMSDVYDEGRAVEIIASVALEAYLLEY